jgi:hypothetical protein
MKLCCKCKLTKPTTDFYANKRMKDGFNTFCILCHKADNVTRKNRNRKNKEFKAAELAWKKAYRERTKEQQAAYMIEWRNKNSNHVTRYGKKYRVQNKERYNYLCQLRKISLMQRTPKWLSEDDFWVIEQAYKLSSLRTKMFGFQWHVDHIIPLRGKVVSGLHTPTNLQVIPWIYNQRKTNKFEVEHAA